MDNGQAAARVPHLGSPPGIGTRRLGDVLVESGLFAQEAIDRLALDAKHADVRLGEYLVSKHLITLTQLYDALGKMLNQIPIRSVAELPAWDVLLNDVGQVMASGDRPSTVLALGVGADLTRGERRCFVLTTAAGRNMVSFASVFTRAAREGFTVRAVLVAKDQSVLDVVLSEWRARRGSNDDAAGAASMADKEIHIQWDRIIYEAYRRGASDVHLKIARGRGEIKFRINGSLRPHPLALTTENALLLASSMYNTMVDEGSTGDGFNRRISQSAVVTRQYSEGALRLRYEGLPIEPDGVYVTLRLIPIGVEIKPKSFTELGYSDDQAELLERIFARSSGLILFVGTTGSGKSTSMAHALMEVVRSRPDKLLRTVEEPVEIIIPGASQTSIVRRKQLAGEPKTNEFVEVMRSLMRSDPDYLMVGEIRDPDTASLAIQEVRSGHLCVSTLHADGAPIVYDRLSGLGIPRAELASVNLVAGLIYQRLVPVLCPHCKLTAAQVGEMTKTHDRLFTRLRRRLNHGNFEGIYFANPAGCTRCDRTGIAGRTVCAEILVPRPSMMKAIASGDSHGLWSAWRSEIDEARPDVMQGRTAFEHALLKMRQGIVSPADVEREFFFLDTEVFA